MEVKELSEISLPDHVTHMSLILGFAALAVMADSDAQRSANKEREEQEALTRSYLGILTFTQDDANKAVVLNFKDLQLVRIKDLQQKLFVTQMRLRVGGIPPADYQDELKTLDENLFAYANALRNYDYLSQNTRRVVPAGFTLFGPPAGLEEVHRVSPHRRLLHLFNGGEFEYLVHRCRDWVKYTSGRKVSGGDFWIENFDYRELDAQGLQERLRKEHWKGRFAMALFGGVALIGPTLIMTLHPGQTTSLTTTSLATLLFALALALFWKSGTGKDVLEATAAYAAVLIVFVGTSLAPSSPSIPSSSSS